MAFSSSSRHESPAKQDRTEGTTLDEDFEISKTVIQVPENILDYHQTDFELMQDMEIEPRKPKWENKINLNYNR